MYVQYVEKNLKSIPHVLHVLKNVKRSTDGLSKMKLISEEGKEAFRQISAMIVDCRNLELLALHGIGRMESGVWLIRGSI